MHNIRKFFIEKRILSCHQIHERTCVRSYVKKKSRKVEKSTEKALKHFDDFYKGIFKKRWHSIRLGMLTPPKHVALINNFGDIDQTQEYLKQTGALDLRVLLKNSEDNFESRLIKDSENVKRTLITLNENEIEEEITEAFNPVGFQEKSEKALEDYEIELSDEDYNEDLEQIKADGSSVSLHEALSQSEIDTSRLIDPSLGLDSSSIHEFVPVTEVKGKEEYIPEGDYYRFYKANSDISVNIELEQELHFPDYLNVYSYPRGDTSAFPRPVLCKNNVMNYYPLDGASILVLLALDLKYGECILDMCSAPGGKALGILQTMLPRHVVCNDKSISRTNRLKTVFKQYLGDDPSKWEHLSITIRHGECYSPDMEFDKILVDVPCTTDRHSATVDDNNIFKAMRTAERLRLPSYQSAILENALRIVKPGGTVIYSTCTLSPIQNDGVVNMTLQKVWVENRMEFTVKDLGPALQRWSSFYKFATTIGLKYGSLVVPFVPINFGPMYFCKLVKEK